MRNIILTVLFIFSFISASDKMSVPDFDGDKAFEYIKTQCDFGPRYPGSLGHQQLSNYLYDYFILNSDSVSIFTDSISHPVSNEKIQIKNFLIQHNLDSDERYLFMAHWDTRDRADKDLDTEKQSIPILGANDGGSGVALLMQLSSHIKNDINLTNIGIDILLVDAEDMGRPGHVDEWGLGTQSFVKQYKGILPKYAICVDMIADKNPIFKIEKFSYNYAKDLVYEIWELANDLGHKEFVWQLTHPIYDDHVYYHQGTGVPAIDIIDFDFPEWHTVDDTIENCSSKGLFIVGDVLLNFIINKERR
tara:strand:- start:218 stop:1132 length:915 start_codon:yes stop_codon:yes gene_type:complete